MNWLGRYARVVDHLAVKNVAQGAPPEVDLLCTFKTGVPKYIHT